MFFRREKAHQFTFEDRLANLKQFGITSRLEASGSARVTRGDYGAIVQNLDNGNVKVGKAGVLVGDEIALLVNAGYQMFLRTPSGRDLPALATQLQGLHAFEEDLLEGLGLPSLYNVALGTTSDDHLYDRVENRDAAPHPRPWEVAHKSKPAAGR